jgi:S-DNA-T family DNA segregation ATPase FtsK/SpoIIIE
VLDALVAAAQRGRSLGVNLVLATQRPGGSVSDNIRANVALRIALRLHDAADSVDVIGLPDAADLPRSVPGRALLRRGPDSPDAVQLAHVSRAAPPPDHRRVALVPFGCGPTPRAPSAEAAAASSDPTDLDAIVETCRAAFAASGAPPPRPVWTPPLPDDLPLSALPSRGGEVVVGHLDVPDEQTRLDLAWQPTAGPLLLVGAAGSGLTTTLATLALRATALPGDAPAHLYVLDGAGNELRALARLAGVGDVVGPADRARQRRLVRRLGDELRDRRREPEGTRPAIVVLVDDVGSLLRAWDDPLDDVLDRLGELVADGTASGIHVVLAAERLGAIPVAWQAAAVQRWLFRSADPFEHAGHAVPAGPPGRVTALPSGHLGQVARPDAGLAAAVGEATDTWPHGLPRPAPVGELPGQVHVADLRAAAQLDTWPWSLPVGLGEHHLAPVGWTLHGGDTVLVAGPRRSGRSSVLAGLAASVAAAGAAPAVVVVAPERSPLARLDGGFERLPAPTAAASVRALLERPRPVLLLVDDADLLPDDGHGLAALLAERPPGLVTVVAAGAEVVRSRYGHLARAAGRGGLGLLLRPDPDLDGDLLGVRLPRRAPVALTPGRGWLVGERELEVVQTPLVEVD